MWVISVLFAKALHDGDGSDGIFDLAKFALEFFDIFLDVSEDGWCADFARHPGVIDDVFGTNSFVLLDRQ